MAYENLKFRKPNMTIADGYFYTFDHDYDVLFEKTDGGNVACSYPLNSVLNNQVVSAEYDGVNFWSSEKVSSTSVIKRWRIEDNICVLKQIITLTPNFDSDAFTVEHYHTVLSTAVSGGQTIIHIDDYTTIVSGTTLSIGTEDISVSSVSGTDVILASGTQYAYDAGTAVNFYNHLWVFNNYGTGSLHKVDAYTGGSISVYSDTEYDDVNACTFNKFGSEFTNPVDALIYVKLSNIKFVNVSTMENYGVMTIDNVRVNSSIIPVYDISIEGSNIYRLHTEANYYGSNVSWSTYNYVLSTTRRFITTVSLSAYPAILPANWVNTLELLALINDQYGDGSVNKQVSFTDNDSIGFVTINPAYTDYFFGTGEAISYYKAGIEVHTVTIEVTATQFD